MMAFLRLMTGCLLALSLVVWMAGCGSDDEASPDGDQVQPDGDGETSPDGDEPDGDDPDGDQTDGDGEDDEPEIRLVDLVNPFIGSGGLGFGIGSGTPGIKTPFGLVLVAPDTTGEFGAPPFYHCSGYYSEDEYIVGFSQVHLYGVGAQDLGNILFMPDNGPLDVIDGYEDTYRKLKIEGSEFAKPGYYTVGLESDITVELTATTRAGYHRYTFAEDLAQGFVLIDLNHHVATDSDDTEDAEIEIVPADQVVKGRVLQQGGFTGRYGGLDIYFYARFDKPIESYGTWKDNISTDGQTSESGDPIGAYIGFDLADGATVEAQVGISFISIEQAKLNLETEMPDWGFESVRQQTEDAWEDELSVVRFEGGTDDQRAIMATALYHAFMMPDIFTDANGQYLGFDGQVHTAEDFVYYTDFSMWDTYRTEHPFLSLVKPERSRDMMISLVTMMEQGGYLPKWPMGKGYSNCMVGSPADIVIADAYLKGVRGFDVEAAYASMKEVATAPVPSEHAYGGRGGIDEYVANGYVSMERSGGSVARTMEFAVADNAIAQLATVLGYDTDAAAFIEQSRNYRNLWLDDDQFFVGRHADGSFVEDYNSTTWEDFYTEGNAWQYLWLAPHDPEGLIELFGSAESMKSKLETFFEEEKKEFDEGAWGGYLPPTYYWHGNEPDIHAAYLFLEVGRPDLTHKWVRWIEDSLYKNAPDGIAGNDDCGTLSSWYVFSSMGLFPNAGMDWYWIGAPLFTRVEVQLADGVLVIEAPEASEDNLYVQSVTFNDEPLTEPRLEHARIAEGGVLRFEMGPEPSDWGRPTR